MNALSCVNPPHVSKQLETKMNDYMNSIPDVVDSKQQILKEGD